MKLGKWRFLVPGCLSTWAPDVCISVPAGLPGLDDGNANYSCRLFLTLLSLLLLYSTHPAASGSKSISGVTTPLPPSYSKAPSLLVQAEAAASFMVTRVLLLPLQ